MASDTQESVQRPTTDKSNTKRINFSVDSKNAEVINTDDTTRLSVPISSLQDDRDGDQITQDGMDSLIGQVNSDAVGLFPNHGMDPSSSMYDFRDIFGAWESAYVRGRYHDGRGSPSRS